MSDGHPLRQATPTPRPLTYAERRAAEAAFLGFPLDPTWPRVAQDIYEGILRVRHQQSSQRRELMVSPELPSCSPEERGETGEVVQSEDAHPAPRQEPGVQRPFYYGRWIVVLMGCFLAFPTSAIAGIVHEHEQVIPILGITMGERPMGTVANLIVQVHERDDQGGLVVQFTTAPGRFSRMAQTSVQQAIHRAARIAGLSTDSWTVILRVPYEGVTIYGDSLSAMIALTVMALAKHDLLPPDRVITGTVTSDGHIGPVGSLQLKVGAANDAHLRRVMVPDELDVSDSDWETPFLLQVSPVGSVTQAYEALTDHPLVANRRLTSR